MTRKEALEYVNNMYMYEDTKNALETLIPEFGKTCSDKVIDHEDKYKEALLEARAVLEPCLKYSNGKVREALDSIDKELKSFESEDERIRRFLFDYTIEMIAGLESDISHSIYEGIKGHDPDAEAELNQWQKARAYLEKQKEQKPVEPSDDELQRHQDELYDFKVFAAKQAKEHHISISFVHDFEWNNFCAELLSYFNEQKPAWSEEDEKRVKQLIYDTEHIRAEYEKRKKELGESFNDELIKDCDEQIAWLKAISLNHKKFNEAVEKLCSNEWSKEDEEMRNALWNLLKIQYPQDYYMTGAGIKAGKFRDWLKSLRLHKKEDLPKWRKWRNGGCGNVDGIPIAIVKSGTGYELVSSLGMEGQEYIMISDLEKLPKEK